MAASKIVDESEVVRWIEEGRTYQWMVDEYARKYNTEMTLSAFGNFRRRRGLTRRTVRDTNLVPWQVKLEHRWNYKLMMLRMEGRRRAGHELPADARRKVNSFLRNDVGTDKVVSYDPNSAQGFWLVEREPGDADIVRQPARSLVSQRQAAD